jgi:hypothetical protein
VGAGAKVAWLGSRIGAAQTVWKFNAPISFAPTSANLISQYT